MVENARRRWPGRPDRGPPRAGPGSAGGRAGDGRRSTALDELPEVDVIVIARGGGSLEDLLAFSDEGLVRAVVAARTPVVSAIGHETDNPILDLVADVRASTPTDAAKRVVPDVTEERTRIRQVSARLRPPRRRADRPPAGVAARAALPTGPGRPDGHVHRARRPARQRPRPARSARSACWSSTSPSPSPTTSPGSAPCRPRRRSSGATPSSSGRRATRSPRCRTSTRTTTCWPTSPTASSSSRCATSRPGRSAA